MIPIISIVLTRCYTSTLVTTPKYMIYDSNNLGIFIKTVIFMSKTIDIMYNSCNFIKIHDTLKQPTTSKTVNPENPFMSLEFLTPKRHF